ncbi:S8 family serine peptidase [Altererythrobacter sp. KTW20L]|uniref:S8 family serine peptidase n=1 Tax=Altererythrobacter sp. KTW20L TaxID=2942210 RepID=UPI0020C1873A|nr:S8 family serine peptidase [Altererythrobacter sp. KTW20L]MCL6250574.1 S8 family serine peptidase [Altererythrobacter sp. KTW20L]
MAVLPIATGPASAQIGLPGLGLPDTGQVLDPLDRTLGRIERDTSRIARDLLRDRERTLFRFLRQNSEFVEVDRTGQPARRGELLLMDLTPEAARVLEQQGFALLAQEDIAGLGFIVSRLAVPARMSLAEAQGVVAALAPSATVAPDNIHFQSGTNAGPLAAQASVQARTASTATRVPVGMIDGAPSARIGEFAMRGFARGAPAPSDHGTSIAHLLMQTGVRDIRVADVYGTDPAGGGALAIARGLGWLVEDGSRVVTISLVGPRNPVVERAIGAARSRGAVVVAAVGNDGPAAPPAYPASYEGVVAVTGVDGRKRALIEAGRALHLDYSAPGADLSGRNVRGSRVRLRGTSYATPLVAARIAAAMERGANWRIALDAEAEDLGEPGHDEVFGRGLICGGCGKS